MTDPAQAARAGRATVETLHPKEILVAHTPSAVSAALFHAYLSGLMAQGTQVVEAGIATLPELRHALWLHRSDAAALVGSDGVTVLNGRGAVLTRKRQRAMTTLLLRQDYSGPFTGITRPPVNSGRTELTYVAWLAGRFAAPAKEAPGVAVFAEDTRLLSIAEKAFSRAGLRVHCEWEEEMMELSDGEVGVWLGQSGESASFYGQDGPLTEAEN